MTSAETILELLRMLESRLRKPGMHSNATFVEREGRFGERLSDRDNQAGNTLTRAVRSAFEMIADSASDKMKGGASKI